MAENLWYGASQAISQVSTVQITAYHASTLYRISIGGKYVQVAGDTDVNTTAEALQEALAASSIAEFAEVTWTVSTDTVTGTATTAGVPFTATSSVSGGSGTIGAVTAVTASKGPSHWGDVNNWSLGAVPVDTDDVVIASGASIKYDLDQSAVTLASLRVRDTYEGDIGLPVFNEAGGYREYRDTYLAVKVTAAGGIHVGDAGAGSIGRCKIDASTVQTILSVYSAGSPKEPGVPAVLFKGTHASNVINVQKGSVGVAFLPGEAATVATGRQGSLASEQADAEVVYGPGCTLTTLVQSGGKLEFSSSVTTLTVRAGEAVCKLAASITNLDGQKGKLTFNSSGTAGSSTCVLGKGFTLDFGGDPRAKAVGAVTMNAGSSLLDSKKTLSGTPAITLVDCGLGDVNVDLGSDITITRS